MMLGSLEPEVLGENADFFGQIVTQFGITQTQKSLLETRIFTVMQCITFGMNMMAEEQELKP